MKGAIVSALIEAEKVAESRSTWAASANVVVAKVGPGAHSFPSVRMIGQRSRARAHVS